MTRVGENEAQGRPRNSRREAVMEFISRDWLRTTLVSAWTLGLLMQIVDAFVFGPHNWSDWAVLGLCIFGVSTSAAVPWKRISPFWVIPLIYVGIVAVGLATVTGGPDGVISFLFLPALIATIFFWRVKLAIFLAILPCCVAMVVVPLFTGDLVQQREAFFTAALLPMVTLLLGALYNATRGASHEQERMRGTVAALLASLEARDGYTADHSSEVLDLVRAVAARLRLSERERQVVAYVGLLHDIGKIAIPNEILNKQGPLTDDEWIVMREHPVIGEQIVREVPGFADVADAVRHEHERWDGKGYPDGIAADTIPVASRIVLTCDAFHAMTSDRPYRKSIGHEAAREELVRCAGTQFDPDVVNALLTELDDRMAHSRRNARKRARQVLADSSTPLADALYVGQQQPRTSAGGASQ